MRPRLVFALTVFLLAGLVWADEPWKEKSYAAWNDSDVRRILEGSPWAKTITVPATWLRTGAQGPEVGTKIVIPGGRLPKDLEKDPAAPHDKLWNQYANFLLRWESSRTVRAALRLKALRQSSSPSAKKADLAGDPELAADPKEYELLLIGDLLAPFPMAAEGDLMANSLLLCVTSGVRLTPTRVKAIRRDDGQILEVRFYFRKTTPDGRPTLSGGEKAIEFQCKIRGAYLRARFEPARMVDADGPDLR